MATQCDSLPTTVAPDSLGTDNPPPAAYITKKDAKPTDKIVDKCNTSLWLRYRPEDGAIEVVGDVHMKTAWPEDVDRYFELIHAVARKQWIPAAWIAGFIAQESSGIAEAVSSAGATGLMQIMPGTAKWLSDPNFPNQTSGHVGPTADELMDPEVNVELGTRFLRYLADKYADNFAYMAGHYSHGSMACGKEVGVKDPKTGVRKECPVPMHDWKLITHCGYIDGVIGYTNLAIERGYMGLREIDLGDGEESGTSSRGIGIALGLAIGVGAVAAAAKWMKK